MPTSETAISALLRMVSVACFWSLSGHRSCSKKQVLRCGRDMDGEGEGK